MSARLFNGWDDGACRHRGSEVAFETIFGLRKRLGQNDYKACPRGLAARAKHAS